MRCFLSKTVREQVGECVRELLAWQRSTTSVCIPFEKLKDGMDIFTRLSSTGVFNYLDGVTFAKEHIIHPRVGQELIIAPRGDSPNPDAYFAFLDDQFDVGHSKDVFWIEYREILMYELDMARKRSVHMLERIDRNIDNREWRRVYTYFYFIYHVSLYIHKRFFNTSYTDYKGSEFFYQKGELHRESGFAVIPAKDNPYYAANGVLMRNYLQFRSCNRDLTVTSPWYERNVSTFDPRTFKDIEVAKDDEDSTEGRDTLNPIVSLLKKITGIRYKKHKAITDLKF